MSPGNWRWGAAAHKRNVIHRDLKPANVMVDEDGEARITDFGVARSAGDTGITGSGVVIGTPEYLSPEQARAEPLDARSDLYALGLILFEMLTGTLPFRGGTPAEMLVQRIVRDPPSADTIQADLPPFAVKLCSWLLELRVARRIASAEAVVKAIDTGSLAGRPRVRGRSVIPPRPAGPDRACRCRLVLASTGCPLQARPHLPSCRVARPAAVARQATATRATVSGVRYPSAAR
jgi:serine/threonine protein kinase